MDILGRIQPDSDFAVLLLKLRIEAQKLKIPGIHLTYKDRKFETWT